MMNFTDENNNSTNDMKISNNFQSTPTLFHTSVQKPNQAEVPQQPLNQNYSQANIPQQPLNQNYSQANIPQQPLNQNYSQANIPQQPSNQNYSQANIPQQPLNQNYSQTNIPQQPLNQNYSQTNIPQQPLHQNYAQMNIPQQPSGQNYPPQNSDNSYWQQHTVSAVSKNTVEYNNPYEQQFDPGVTYYPYYNGTPVPYGAKTHYINGRWYYAIKGPAPKRKMALSVKLLIVVIITMAIALTVALFWWSSANAKSKENFSWEDFFKQYQVPDDGSQNNEDKSSSNIIGKYADPNGPEILLEKLDTSSGSTEKAYEKLSVSVVSVSVYKNEYTPQTGTPYLEGTGIVISEDGYIVTNSHVINNDSQSKVYITTKDSDVFSAVVVGNDTRTDIAVLKCSESNHFFPAEFTSSDNLKVGQDVVAIGSPGGSSYSSSITKGIVSALNRTLSGNANAYIQTDTAINPGNSGGPLATLNGQVVGINTIKIVDTQYEGMGFAIPSVTVKEIADSLIKHGIVKDRPRLGIVGQEVSEAMAKSTNKVSGIEIKQIDNDSPFHNTKVKTGDVITKIDGVEIHSFYQLFSVLDNYAVGDTVTVTLCRTDSQNNNEKDYLTVNVVLIGD